MRSISMCRLALILTLAALLPAQQSKSRATEHRLESHDKSPFFVVPPRDAKARKPALLVVMPGGPGTPDFLPWVENGILGAAPADCVGVMVTAVKWRDNQKIVWPTGKSKVRGTRYTTDSYVLAVVKQVRKTYDIDPGRIALLAWSSSGPAAYLLLTGKRTPFVRGYVAMSVWRPLGKAEIQSAAGRRFVLEQSPEDTTTTFSHVRRAFAALHASKAVVRLSTYEGGHGWHDSPVPRLRKNLTWLFGDDPAPEPMWPDGEDDEPPSKDGNLLKNASFESGVKGWRTIGNSGRLTVGVDKGNKKDGKQALHLQKTGGMPLDLVDQGVRLSKGSTVKFSIQVRTADARNAWVKLWLYDDDDQVTNEDVNVAQLRGTAGWKRYTLTLEVGKATRAVVQIIMVMGGELWLDDVVLTVDK